MYDADGSTRRDKTRDKATKRQLETTARAEALAAGGTPNWCMRRHDRWRSVGSAGRDTGEQADNVVGAEDWTVKRPCGRKAADKPRESLGHTAGRALGCGGSGRRTGSDREGGTNRRHGGTSAGAKAAWVRDKSGTGGEDGWRLTARALEVGARRRAGWGQRTLVWRVQPAGWSSGRERWESRSRGRSGSSRRRDRS